MTFKQQRIVLHKRDVDGSVILYFPTTSIDYVEGAIKNITLNEGTLTITYVDGTKKEFTGAMGPQGPQGESPDISMFVNVNEVANEANKIPRYNSDGHLVLPSGVELW